MWRVEVVAEQLDKPLLFCHYYSAGSCKVMTGCWAILAERCDWEMGCWRLEKEIKHVVHAD